MEQPDPWIPDQPTAPLFICAHCGAGPIEERICIPCYNALIIALRADVTRGDRSDFINLETGAIFHNHRDGLFDADWVQFCIDNHAYIPYTTIVHLVIARAIRRGDL